MIQFGMPSLIETKTVEQSVALCNELGLSFVELNMNFPQFQPWSMDAEELKQLAKKYGVFYTIHLDDNLNIADFNPYVTDGYRRTVRETIELAKKVGIRVLNMHLAKGAVYTLPQKKVYFFGEYEEEYLAGIKAFRDACEALIGSSGIRICVENTDGFESYHKAAIDLLLKSPVFGLTIDIGHNYCAKRMDEPVIMERLSRLHHMHMHDARDGKKDHQALGTGELDIPYFIKLADGNHCTVVLETKTEEGLRQSVAWLRENYKA